MDNKIYFPKKLSIEHDDLQAPALQAVRDLLQYMNIEACEMMNLLYHTQFYLQYDMTTKQSSLISLNSYQLLCYAIGAYYEQFSFIQQANFRKYLLRHLKMRISIPLVSISSNLIVEDSYSNPIFLYVLCIGYNEENDEMIIIHPKSKEYVPISISALGMNHYDFILINFPGMLKSKIIPSYRERILRYYDQVLQRTDKEKIVLVGYKAIAYMMNKLNIPNIHLIEQLDNLRALEMEVDYE